MELHNEKLYDLYSSPNIIQVIISSMRWAGQAARMGAVAYRGEGGVKPPPRNSEVLTKLSRIPSSVENTSVTT